MYKMVEEQDNTPLEGFAFTNRDNYMEGVKIYSNTYFDIFDAEGNTVSIYVSDIPKLIKTLQVTEAHYKEVNK